MTRFNISADDIKNIIVHYYIEKRKFLCAVTEFKLGGNIADVLAINDNEIVEIEVKISKQDFLNDFKKEKHNLSLKAANRFYYAIPEHLYNFVCSYLEKHNYNDIGIIIINKNLNVVIKKPAELIQDNYIVNNDYLIKKVLTKLSLDSVKNKSLE